PEKHRDTDQDGPENNRFYAWVHNTSAPGSPCVRLCARFNSITFNTCDAGTAYFDPPTSRITRVSRVSEPAINSLATPNPRDQTIGDPSEPSNVITGQLRRSHNGTRNSWNSVLIFSAPELTWDSYRSPGRQFRSKSEPAHCPQSS